MQLFKPKPKPPLDDMFTHINAAVEILYTHKRDKSYQPTEQDLLLVARAREMLWLASCAASYIETCLQQRLRGESEGSRKFTDQAVMDYHHP